MDLGSGIRKKSIPDPGSRGQKGTGSRIRIRHTDPEAVLWIRIRSDGTGKNHFGSVQLPVRNE
jgi:hypothetical protein